MAITQSSFLTSMIILMAFLPPLIQASRLRFQGDEELVTTVEESLEIIGNIKGSNHVKSLVGPRFEGGGSRVLIGLYSSARQVPTGPDPLHHHKHDPVRP